MLKGCINTILSKDGEMECDSERVRERVYYLCLYIFIFGYLLDHKTVHDVQLKIECAALNSFNELHFMSLLRRFLI